MKKFFQVLGFIVLFIFSFYYTEKTVSVVKEYDDIMIKIKEKSEEYNLNSTDAVIDGNTIIPGLSGRKIDINKSYNRMRRYGKYDENLLIYKNVLPSKTVKNNYNHYIISGSKEKKEVSLIFIVRRKTDIKNILKILDVYGIKANFFIDYNWLEDNNDLFLDLVRKDHLIGNLGDNMRYTESSLAWIDTVIKRVGKQKDRFCYTEKFDEKKLNTCLANKNYMIKPSIKTNEYPYKDIKNSIKKGSIVSFEVNNNLNREIINIIEYIKSKDLEIVTLDKIIDESINN
jgi:peptidoglycan/xylan/chitin deacetylase (PgdA/CDA1 family)